MTRRVKFVVEYDGGSYHGWQRQPGFPSIQQTLEETFEKIIQTKVIVIGSGRTDKGVHAVGQVAHCDVTTLLNDTPLKKAINSQLPQDIIIKDLQTTSDTFHAQKNARSKIYIYKILNSPLPALLLREQSWWIPKPLDTLKMNEAAQIIIGKHDFKSFQNRGTPRTSTVRKIYMSQFHWDPPFLLYEVKGSGFLKQMVRNLVGAFVKVGKGHLSLEKLRFILNAKDRRCSPPPAPAKGLCLKEVTYETTYDKPIPHMGDLSI